MTYLDSKSIISLIVWHLFSTPDQSLQGIRSHWVVQISQKHEWFTGCSYFELLVQLPFFCIAVFGYAIDASWIRLPNLVFSSASAAIMIPILSELILTSKSFNRAAVLPMYAPFAVLPVVIMLRTYSELRSAYHEVPLRKSKGL